MGFLPNFNHGVPIKVIQDLKATVHRFFGLPAEEKKYLKEKSPPEFVRLTSSFNLDVQALLEWIHYVHLVYALEEKINAYWPALCK